MLAIVVSFAEWAVQKNAELYEEKKMSIADIAECNLKVVAIDDLEDHITVTKMNDIKFCHPHSRACSLRSTVTARCWHRRDLFLYIGRRGQFLIRKG